MGKQADEYQDTLKHSHLQSFPKNVPLLLPIRRDSLYCACLARAPLFHVKFIPQVRLLRGVPQLRNEL